MAALLTGDSVMTGCCHCKKIYAHLSLQIAASESMGDSSLYTNKDHLGLCCSAEQLSHVKYQLHLKHCSL